jgi:putative phosphoserine phosphatase/1-acylglycerol-3-phosphate O-acyltransferase
MAAGAFFDLDRTLLNGASGPVISAELRAAAVLPERTVPGEGLLFGLFNAIGETWPSMLLTRQAARAAKGWPRAGVRAAAKAAAAKLVDQVQPYAHVLIEHHRGEGRPVVMATTTPYDVVAPLAEALGLDGVVATRYGGDDEHYDGTIDGEFVWGRGKLRAVQAWARANGVDLGESWAYSDSFYDLPLLAAAAHPVAVNADPRLAAVAAVRRWPQMHLDVPPGVPKVLGVEPQQVFLPFTRPELLPFAHFDIDGVDNIPRSGGALLCANHRSYFDPLAVGVTVARRGRPVRALGKKEVFDAPVIGPIARAMGGIRVDRGTGSDVPLQAAEQALRAGELVAVMPQGTIPRGRAFFEPELKGRWGAARLAGATGVPVVPIGLWGTEQVWPRCARFPDVARIVDPPTVRVRVGEPITVPGEDPEEDTVAIMDAVRDLLPPEAQVDREPSEEELIRTYPPGYSGDPEAESARRPGSD